MIAVLHCSLWLCALQVAATGADALTTQYTVSFPTAVEHDPLARPFVLRGPVLLSVFFAGDLAGSLYAERQLKIRGHKKMSLILTLGEIAGHGFGAAWSAKHYRSVR
jgi:hypothetical protein